MKIIDALNRVANMAERIEASNRTVVDAVERLNATCGDLLGKLTPVRTLATSTDELLDLQRDLKQTFQGLIMSNTQVFKAQEEFIMQLRSSTETLATYLTAYQPADQRKDYRESLRTPPPSVHVTTAADGSGSAAGDTFTRAET